MNKINVLGIPIDPIKIEDAELRLEKLMNKKNCIICTINTEFVVLAQKNDEFKEIITKKSSLNLADGIGPMWAARFKTFKTPSIIFLREITIFLQWIGSIILIPFYPNLFKKPIPERISGSDFIWTIARFSADNKYRIFLLGGALTIAERVALELQTKIPELRVSGVHSGGVNETEEIINAIKNSKADILLIAYGAPKQEKWLAENLKKTGCCVGVGLGGTFDFIAQAKRRAPVWMRKSGLEWLFRLMQEPKRIIRQMALPKFMWLVLKERYKTH